MGAPRVTANKFFVVALSLSVVAVGAVVFWALSNSTSSTQRESPDGAAGNGTDYRGTAEKPPSLPEEYVPPTPRDPRLTAFVDRTSKNVRIPPGFGSYILPVGASEDIEAVRQVLLDVNDDDTVRNEAVNLLHRSGDPRLIDDLAAVVHNPKEEERFRAFATQHLGLLARKGSTWPRDEAVAHLRCLLEDRHIAVRREAVWALVYIGDVKGKETALAWLHDAEAEGVRDLAIRCVRRLGLKEETPAIRCYLRHPDEPTRIAAIVTLSQWGDAVSRKAIEHATKSDSFRVRRCAEIALERLDRAVGSRRDKSMSEAAPVGRTQGNDKEADF